MEKKILALLNDLISINSTSHSKQEKEIEGFLYNEFKNINYFMEHTNYFGTVAIPNDPFEREAVYAFVKGKTAKTVILMNHHDTVGLAEYGSLAPYALDSRQLLLQLLEHETSEDVLQDLRSGEWMVGRGCCDMKGGIAVQIALLEEYAKDPDRGSLLFLSLPDEESFSAGMRGVLPFLENWKKRWHLEYILAINSEPCPKRNEKLVVSVGSVGKLLPVVLIQGKSVQIGNYQKGLNPLALLAKLVDYTEGNPSMIDTCKSERTVPPAWSFVRDLKKTYDFSLPMRAAGYCNILTFYRTPENVMDDFLSLCRNAVEDISKRLGAFENIPVMTYGELLATAKERSGFDLFFGQQKLELRERIQVEGGNFPDVTVDMMQAVLDFVGVQEPVIIIGFAPPYYPAVNSVKLGGDHFKRILDKAAKQEPMVFDQYFLGVSDCSYCGLDGPVNTWVYESNTPLWGSLYKFDFTIVSKLAIPFMLLGPWGKDLHCRTERVHVSHITKFLPRTIAEVVDFAWQ